MANRNNRQSAPQDQDEALDYEVGYRKPPKANQFKKGSSGNPKGRPKAVTTADEALQRRLFSTLTVTENGKRRKITVIEAILGRTAQAALSGDHRATGLLIKLLSYRVAVPFGDPSSASDPDADLAALQAIFGSMGLIADGLNAKEAEHDDQRS